MTTFTLTVATSTDGFISRSTDEPPQVWASDEEQDLFLRDVEAADWSIMGRNTHEAAERPDRYRIVFSKKKSGWLRPNQLWIDPADLSPKELAERVAHIRPLSDGLILGGTRVHDWFLKHRAIHKVHLTIEPILFGSGLGVFSNQSETDPLEVFENRGFFVQSETRLNVNGTRYLELAPI